LPAVMLAKVKGGVGATTMARELAAAAIGDGKSVALVDLDGQGSLTKWWNRRTKDLSGSEAPDLALIQEPPERLPNTVAAAARRYDIVFIDVPPSTHSLVGAVMRSCDFAIVPVRPTQDDIDVVPPVLSMLNEAALPFAFVVNQALVRSRLTQDAEKWLQKRGRIAATLHLRTDFPAAAPFGRAAVEEAPRSKAAEEIRELWAFVRDEIKVSRQGVKKGRLYAMKT
jgi:chromosome partitioning protein